ncbi:MAG: fibronectin type III domain-containing protein, partial [Thermoguttaceae bacterium]|nr:fibronectin type III domain-containing protein [Thermoguttaceae bacterium]
MIATDQIGYTIPDVASRGAVAAPLATPIVSFKDKTESSVTFKWEAVSDAASYTVEYKSATDTDWTFLGSGYTAGDVCLSGIASETTYDFRVKANATDSYNESEWGTLSVKTGSKLATPTGLTVNTKTDTSVTFHWTEVENASGYIISYEDKTETVDAETTSITLNELDSNTYYSFRVQAIGEGWKDAVYTASDKSDALDVKTMISLATPSLTFYQKTDKSVTFTNYSVVSGSAYTFEYKLTSETDWTPFATGYTDSTISVTDLLAETAYDFRVKAETHDDYYQSAWGTHSVTTGIALATPTNVISVEEDRTTSSIAVSWDANVNASSYDVYYYISGEMETCIHVPSGTSLTIGKLSAGTYYNVKVQAIGTGTEDAVYTASEQSEPITIKTKTKLDAPVISNNGVLDISASLTWNAIEYATSYFVEQSTDTGTSWSKATATLAENSGVYTATVTNLTAATAYSFRVTAKSTNSDYADSNPSNQVDIRTAVTDTYTVGTVTLAVAHGNYNDPTVIDRTITVTNGKWRVLSSTVPSDKGGSMILNGEGASFTDIEGKTTVYSGETASVNFSGSGVTTEYKLELSSNFTKTVSLNQTGLTLGGIFAYNFTDPGNADVKFYLDGQDVTSYNFTATWDSEQQGFGVGYVNTNIEDGTHTIVVSVAYEGADTSEFAAIRFDFTVTPVTKINGMTISGTEETDWTWNAETSIITILTKNVVLTGNTLSNITIVVNEEASVNNNEVVVTGITRQGGTLQIAKDHGLAAATLTTGGYSDGAYFYLAQDATFVRDENSYTNTADTIGQLQILDEVFFNSGEWNVDVKEGDILGVGSIALKTSVKFAANDQFHLSTLDYTVGSSGGGIRWNTDAQIHEAFGIATATTGENYSGATFTSNSENAFGEDASGTLGGESFYGIMLAGGDWTVTYNDSPITSKDMTAHLLDGSITASTEDGEQAGEQVKWNFSDATTENGVNASSVDFNFNYETGKVKDITTNYSASGYLFTSKSTGEIVASNFLDVQEKTISMNHGVWTVNVLSNES